jgi:hypothetical protein
MGGADASAIVPVEVLVKVNVVPKVRIALQPIILAKNRSAALLISPKYSHQTAAQFNGNVVNCYIATRPGWTFDLKVVSVVMMKLLQGLDDEIVHGKPNRAAPVRVAPNVYGV